MNKLLENIRGIISMNLSSVQPWCRLVKLPRSTCIRACLRLEFSWWLACLFAYASSRKRKKKHHFLYILAWTAVLTTQIKGSNCTEKGSFNILHCYRTNHPTRLVGFVPCSVEKTMYLIWLWACIMVVVLYQVKFLVVGFLWFWRFLLLLNNWSKWLIWFWL